MPLFKQVFEIFSKLILVLTTFAPVIETSKKDEIVLEKISYIYYLLYF